MTKETEKNNGTNAVLLTTPAVAEKVFYGGVTEEQYNRWKDEYSGKVLEISVIHPTTNKTLGCYLKPMGRNEISQATMFQANKHMLEGGEVILENCWLGGDAVLRNPGANVFDQQAAAAAAMRAWSNFTIAEAKAIKNG